MIKGPTIYKKDSRGKIRTWRFEVHGDAYIICDGTLGGKEKASKPKVCPPKSQKTGELQAFFEAEAAMKKKLRIDYHEDMAHVDRGPHVFLPMLALEWNKLKPGDLQFPVYSQPKYDGIRSLQHKKGAWSRGGKKQFTFDHVLEENEPWRKELFAFDGELYGHIHREAFNQISSLVRKTKAENITDEVIARVKSELSYYVYDCYIPGMAFEDRWFFLKTIFEQNQFEHMVLAETTLCHTREEVDELNKQYIADGYEGQILRDPRAVYELDHRSRIMVKRKEFFVEDFPVIRIEGGTGNWQGAAKKVFVRLPDGTEGSAGLDGPYDLNAQRLKEADDYVDGTATIRFTEWTPDGKLGKGVCKDLVKGERED